MNIEEIWPEWHNEKTIGRGSYGTVYKCYRYTGNGEKEYSAVKVISVPQDDFDAQSVDSETMDLEQSRSYYKEIVDVFLNEIKILEKLKYNKNIVNIYDSKIVEKTEGVGWQIFIRMELLTDFNTYSSDKEMTPEKVTKLALDLCEALSVCSEKKIIHRDIKPENIFVDSSGNFKLGDFGVARQIEKTYASMSRKGTYNYMAPEVLAAKKYDSRADIYSLGIVMYKLLNNNRLPFIDPSKQIIKFSERQEAFEKRIRGDKLPAIPDVDDKLNRIILKACEFKPEDRYKNIEEFKSALMSNKTSTSLNSNKKIKIISAVAVFLVFSIVVGMIGYHLGNRNKKKPEPESGVSAAGSSLVSGTSPLSVTEVTTSEESDKSSEDKTTNKDESTTLKADPKQKSADKPTEKLSTAKTEVKNKAEEEKKREAAHTTAVSPVTRIKPDLYQNYVAVDSNGSNLCSIYLYIYGSFSEYIGNGEDLIVNFYNYNWRGDIKYDDYYYCDLENGTVTTWDGYSDYMIDENCSCGYYFEDDYAVVWLDLPEYYYKSPIIYSTLFENVFKAPGGEKNDYYDEGFAI